MIGMFRARWHIGRRVALVGATLLALGGVPASAATVKEFAQPNAIGIGGASEALWFATPTQVGRMDGSGRLAASYALPANVTVVNGSPGEPFPIGSDGSMWFSAVRRTSHGTVRLIGHVSPSGTFSFHPLPKGHGGLIVATDGRGDVWFPDHFVKHHQRVPAVGELTPSGRIKDYRVPSLGADIVGISAGPGKKVWFTSCSTNGASAYVGWIDQRGHARAFYPHGPWCPGDLVAGPDGAMWFTAALDQLGPHSDRIGRITPAGVVSYYSTGLATTEPDGIAVGGDGAIWFTEHSTPAIARITTSGQSSRVALPTSSEPTQIVLGPGNALWFLDQQTGGYGADPSARIGVISGGSPNAVNSLP